MAYEAHSSNSDSAIIDTYENLGDASLRIREHSSVGNSDCFIKNVGEVSNTTIRQEGGTYYADMAIQPIHFIMDNGLGYCEGNVIKYVSRYKNKNGVEDLKKAIHYLEILIGDIEDES